MSSHFIRTLCISYCVLGTAANDSKTIVDEMLQRIAVSLLVLGIGAAGYRYN